MNGLAGGGEERLETREKAGADIPERGMGSWVGDSRAAALGTDIVVSWPEGRGGRGRG